MVPESGPNVKTRNKAKNMANKGTFNAGWWNCFHSFAAELPDQNPCATDICENVLSAAGITEREAAWQLEHPTTNNPRVGEVIRNYWLNCK